jgi:hypothetical protein
MGCSRLSFCWVLSTVVTEARSELCGCNGVVLARRMPKQARHGIDESTMQMQSKKMMRSPSWHRYRAVGSVHVSIAAQVWPAVCFVFRFEISIHVSHQGFPQALAFGRMLQLSLGQHSGCLVLGLEVSVNSRCYKKGFLSDCLPTARRVLPQWVPLWFFFVVCLV